jgi:hypothetical protein
VNGLGDGIEKAIISRVGRKINNDPGPWSTGANNFNIERDFIVGLLAGRIHAAVDGDWNLR